MKIILYTLLLVGAVSAFRLTKVPPKEIRVKKGHPFKVICTADNWYEVSKQNIIILPYDLSCESEKLLYHPQSILFLQPTYISLYR